VTENNKKERDLALERLTVRAEMRSAHEIEDTKVIQDRASLRVGKKSLPPPFSWAYQFVTVVPAHQRFWIIIIGMLLGAAGYAKAKGWF